MRFYIYERRVKLKIPVEVTKQSGNLLGVVRLTERDKANCFVHINRGWRGNSVLYSIKSFDKIDKITSELSFFINGRYPFRVRSENICFYGVMDE
jgi:hypothetical protein